MTVKELREELEKIPLSFGRFVYFEAGGEIANFLSGFVKADTPVMAGTEGNWSESVEIRMAEKYGIRGVDQFVLLSPSLPYLQGEGGYCD